MKVNTRRILCRRMLPFDVQGKCDRAVTNQVFFPDEPFNEQDALLGTVPPSHRDGVMARLPLPTKDLEADSLIAQWDVVLLKG